MVAFSSLSPVEDAALKVSALLNSIAVSRKLPQLERPLRIAFFGMQSSGKTAGLCSLAGRRLGPSKSGTGTRCPVVYVMRTCARKEDERCEVAWLGVARPATAPSGVFAQVDDITSTLREKGEFSGSPIIVRLRLTTAMDITAIDLPGLRGVMANGAEADNRQITAMWRTVLREAPTLPIVVTKLNSDDSQRESDLVVVRDAMGQPRDRMRDALVLVTHLDEVLRWIRPEDFVEVPKLIERVFGCARERIRFLSWMPEMYDFSVSMKDVENKAPVEWDEYFASIVQLDEDMRARHLTGEQQWGWVGGNPSVGIPSALALLKQIIVDDIRNKVPDLLRVVTDALAEMLATAEAVAIGVTAGNVRERMRETTELFCGLLGSWMRWTGVDLFYPLLERAAVRYPEIRTTAVDIEAEPGLLLTFWQEADQFGMAGTTLAVKFRGLLDGMDVAASQELSGVLGLDEALTGTASMLRLTRVFVVVCVSTFPEPATPQELRQRAGMANADKVRGNVLETVICKSMGRHSEQIKGFVEEMTRWVKRCMLAHSGLAFAVLRRVAPILEAFPSIREQLERILTDIHAAIVTEKMTAIMADMVKKLRISFNGLDLDDTLAHGRLLACALFPTALLVDRPAPAVAASGGELRKDRRQRLMELIQGAVAMGAEDRALSICDLAGSEGVRLVPLTDVNMREYCDEINDLIKSFVIFQHGLVAQEMRKHLKAEVGDAMQNIQSELLRRVSDAGVNGAMFSDDDISLNVRHPVEQHERRVTAMHDDLESMTGIRRNLIVLTEQLSRREFQSPGDHVDTRAAEVLALLAEERCFLAKQAAAVPAPAAAAGAPRDTTLVGRYSERTMHVSTDDVAKLKRRVQVLEQQCAAHRAEAQAHVEALRAAGDNARKPRPGDGGAKDGGDGGKDGA